MTDDGIVDQVTFTRWGLIRWNEIAALRFGTNVLNFPALIIVLRDPAGFRSTRGRERWRLWTSAGIAITLPLSAFDLQGRQSGNVVERIRAQAGSTPFNREVACAETLATTGWGRGDT